MGAVLATLTDLTNMLPMVMLNKATTAQQNAALVYASDTVTDYLSAHYNPPFTAPYPGSVVLRTAQIAAYQLSLWIGYNPNAGPDNRIRQMYDDALRWCEGVAAGRIPVAITDSPVAGVEEGPQLLTDNSRRIEDPAISTNPSDAANSSTSVGPFWWD